MRAVRSLALLVGTALVLSVTGMVPAGAAPGRQDAGLRLVVVKHSLLGTHRWYQQTLNGRPVCH